MFISKKKKEQMDNEISTLKHEVSDLRQIIKTQELIRLRTENARLKEKEQLISRVKFKLKSVAYLEEDGIILVKYEIPPVKVRVNEENEIQKNDFFYAVNKLQLLSLDDLKKISAVVDNIKNKQ